MTEADVLEQTRPVDAPDTCELRACRAGAILRSRFASFALQSSRDACDQVRQGLRCGDVWPWRYACDAFGRVLAEALPLRGGGSFTPARRAFERQ